MAQQYRGPQGMSDRGFDSSRTEADALLTLSDTGRDANDILPPAPRRYVRETLMTISLVTSKPADSLLNLTV